MLRSRACYGPLSLSGMHAVVPSSFNIAHRRFGLALVEFEGPRYQRVSYIQKLMGGGVLAADLRQ
jgi:hypothetical protein